ncbi:putative next to BRCA1 gene 1 protein [Calycina marina]|uniref:Next to BRCA1 gene 1 protein n=1 Tax=Calycina marina TaxID=1763456 RepID=A0A9P7Z1M7_9HELO|nr:putative next to BRCA1 gene 1 protein [Calycina marina]
MASTSATNSDTLVVLKIYFDNSNRKFKLPLRDLGASTLPDKLRFLLNIPSTAQVVFERFSDSAASYVVLDPNNTSVYKQLYRAAKAKLKLKLKVTVVKDKEPVVPKPATIEDDEKSRPVSPVSNHTTQAPLSFERQEQSAVGPSFTASVNELQGRFEDLLLSSRHPAVSSIYNTPNEYSKIPQTSDVPKTTCCSSTNIPVTHGTAARDKWYAELAAVSNDHQSAIRSTKSSTCPASVYSVYCNHCTEAVADEHYHCSICDAGDYDLCPGCVKNGVTCQGDDHWMIKRVVKNGRVTSSSTEVLPPKPVPAAKSEATLVQLEDPEAEEEQEDEQEFIATRTCNSCIVELSDASFVTCQMCEDFDLCIPCHRAGKHGHHPKHSFLPTVATVELDTVANAMLGPGRNVGHNAICDGCDKYIHGVRNKCLDCPDWDYCSSCVVNASFIHPRHRFVPIYEPINDLVTLQLSYVSKSRHHGIYCDGPLCAAGSTTQSYIKGDRYKCAVCHDTDFCASCEAHPSNSHNKTHPLIKFKTPVRNVCITTLGDHEDGKPMQVMGDRHARNTSTATETTPAQSTNAATQVQTVAEVQPTETVKTEPVAEPKIETIKFEPVVEPKVEQAKELPAPIVKEELVAHFVSDAIPDGTVLPPSSVFEQTWYLKNGGNAAWPAGCTVKFVGGDNMCAVDPEHPASVHELVSAAESTTCYTEVAPGQQAGFTVLMRTPARAGNFISYWRLTGPTGEKFGHRLWCDINVKLATPVVMEEPKIETEGSQMIFPKLEKESPSASIHEATPAATEDAEYEVDEFDDFVDEPLENESDDGFMTDEEYDILDASDEEYLASQEQVAKK